MERNYKTGDGQGILQQGRVRRTGASRGKSGDEEGERENIERGEEGRKAGPLVDDESRNLNCISAQQRLF